jgi:hypothetical protein
MAMTFGVLLLKLRLPICPWRPAIPPLDKALSHQLRKETINPPITLTSP